MYDPARDSWNEKKECVGKVTGNEVSQTEASGNGTNDVQREDNEQEKITENQKEEADAEKVIDESEKIQDNNSAVEEKSEEQGNELKRKDTQSAEAEDKETKKRKTEDELESEGGKVEDEGRESPPRSPPRKLKKPSSRLTAEEREQKAKELREKLEKEEKSKEEPSSLDPVRSHYNERPDVGRQKRKQSPIFKLRSFNNFIKSVLIQTHGAYRAVVLDIGCGKGGDLLKWAKNRCTGWIGIDIADVSVEQAKSRYEQMHHKSFWADFCVGDAFSERVEEIVHPDAFPVDVVSIQFSLHYAFKSEETIRTLLDNVSRALKPGGKFLGTIPNADFLMEHVWSTPEGVKSWGNSLYRIQFEDLPPKSLDPPFGHQYSFFLEDAVENVPEYIVPFDSFQKLCTEYGLELTYKKPFLEMFDEETRNDTRLFKLCDRMKVFKDDGSYGIDGDEREAASVYLAFCFSKSA